MKWKVVLENRKRIDIEIASIGMGSQVLLFADFPGERFREYDVWKRVHEDIETRYSLIANRIPSAETKPEEK